MYLIIIVRLVANKICNLSTDLKSGAVGGGAGSLPVKMLSIFVGYRNGNMKRLCMLEERRAVVCCCAV